MKRESYSQALRFFGIASQRDLLSIVLLVLAHKAITVLLMYLTYELLPIFNTEQYWTAHCQWPPGDTPNWQSRITSWNSACYLRIAQIGYEKGSPLCAFYPAWPSLLRVVSFVSFGYPAIAAFIMANALSTLGVILFSLLVRRKLGSETANMAVALLLVFPGAVFFSVPYTESLFFLLAVLLFWGFATKNLCLIACASLLLPLTRAVGIFCLAPIVAYLLSGRKPLQHWVVCLFPLLGYGTYFGCMHAFTGNPFEGFDAQKYYINQPSVANIIDLQGFVEASLRVTQLHGFSDSAIDRVLFMVFLSMLPRIWRMDKTYFWYALGTGLVPAMSNQFLSYNRFIMMCFPVFIGLATVLNKPNNRFLRLYILGMMSSLQVMFLIRHLNYYWAG